MEVDRGVTMTWYDPDVIARTELRGQSLNLAVFVAGRLVRSNGFNLRPGGRLAI